MRGITLRRVKTDQIDGKPILSLPERKERVVYLRLTDSERRLYDTIHQAGKRVFETLKAEGTVMSNFAMILKAILLMRQACLHPSLVKFDENTLLEERNVDITRPLDEQEVKRTFHLLRQNEEDYCVFCNVTVEGPGNSLGPCKHLICSECLETQFSVQSRTKKTGGRSNTGTSPKNQVLCPHCKSMIMRDTLREVPEAVMEVADDTEISSSTCGAAAHYDATKIKALVEDLEFVRGQDVIKKRGPTKSVVFSQFTTLLTLCEKALQKSGFKYARIDGTMSRQARSAALTEFKSNPEVVVFLISIKSGGVGLNLVAGSRVYLMEPYWNPAVEQQAIDRVHRLGQTKEVMTIRFIIKDSVEENMQERQKYKIALAQKALDEEEKGKDNRKRKGAKEKGIDKEALLLEKMESLSILFH